MNKKITKHWLISFFIFHIGLYVIGGLDTLFGESIDTFPRIIFGHTHLALMQWLLFLPMCHLIIGALTYYFAYLKKSFIWLITLMVGLALTALCFLSKFVSYWPGHCIPWVKMCWEIFVFYVSIYYFFNCFRLYKYHKATKALGESNK